MFLIKYVYAFNKLFLYCTTVSGTRYSQIQLNCDGYAGKNRTTHQHIFHYVANMIGRTFVILTLLMLFIRHCFLCYNSCIKVIENAKKWLIQECKIVTILILIGFYQPRISTLKPITCFAYWKRFFYLLNSHCHTRVWEVLRYL